MIDIMPALQFKMYDGKKLIIDLINKNSYEIENFSDLKFILDLIDILPNNELKILDLLGESYSIDYISEMIKHLRDIGILSSSSIINPLKTKVQQWVDNGWSDALILHLSSRNLEYIDDPKEFGGDNNLDLIPENFSNSKPPKYISSHPLKMPNKEISAEEILNAIKNRRSFLPFIRKDLENNIIDSIFWYANQYITDLSKKNIPDNDRNKCFDSAFSALDSYLVLYKNTNDFKIGVYKYNREEHTIELIQDGDFRKDISKLAIGQRRASSGLFSIVITGDWSSYSKRYNHERSYRNLLINTTQLAQYYLVLGTHYSLNSFMTPAIHDENFYNFLQLKDEYPLYITTFG